MDMPVNSSLLTLLVSNPAQDIEQTLQLSIDADPDISIAHDSLISGSKTQLVYRGVTFVMTINRAPQKVSQWKHIFCNLDPADIRFGIDIGLGPHVTGGERVPAIIQALLALGQRLGASMGAVAAVWHPARVVSGFDYFSEVISDYLAGGAFPVLAMVNFRVDDKGAINSTGLALLSGQELHVADNDMEQREMMRRIVRVVHDIAINGPIREAIRLGGLDDKEVLDLDPAAQRGIVKMNVYSIPDA